MTPIAYELAADTYYGLGVVTLSVCNAGVAAVTPGEVCWQVQWDGPVLYAQGEDKRTNGQTT